MDTELSLLSDIKWAIWVLIYLVGVGVVINLARFATTSYPVIKSAIKDHFYNVAADLFDKREFSALIEHCENQLKTKPREGYAYWFLGKAFFELNEFEKAEANFRQAVEIYPAWEK